MFNLGFKQIVINSDAVVVETLSSSGAASGDPLEVAIEGFGTFYTGPGNEGGTSTAPVAPVLGTGTITFDTSAAAVGDVLDVRITLKGAPRILSEIFSGGNGSYGDSGQVLAYQTMPLTAVSTGGVALAAAIIPDFNDKILTFVGAADVATYTFGAGYEGLNIAKVEVLLVKAYADVPTTGTNTGTEGIGQGKQVEAEVRNATFDNIDPYGVQFGGNSAVDVRGQYQTIYWKTANDTIIGDPTFVDQTSGWKNHDHLGYGDANTDATYNPREYIAYVNVLATAALASIEKLANNTVS